VNEEDTRGVKTMQIEFEERHIKQLQAIAERQHRELSEVAQEAVEEYIGRHADRDEFSQKIQRFMQEHAQLLSELAKDDGPTTVSTTRIRANKDKPLVE
jgi:hypothetical protein